MKIYNIKNTTKLFETLCDCKGNVDMVSSNGHHIKLSNGDVKTNLSLLFDEYAHGDMDQLELSFSDGTDAVRMFQFLTSMNNAA